MSDTTRLELMMLFAAGALDAEEARQVRAMIASGDPKVLAALAEAEAVLAQIPEALPEVEVPAEVKDRLRERLAASATTPMSNDAPSAPAASKINQAGPLARLAPWLAAAAMAAVVSGVVWLVFSGQVEQRTQQIAELESDLIEKDAALLTAQERAASAREVINAMERDAEAGSRQRAELETRIDTLTTEVAAADAARTRQATELETRIETLTAELGDAADRAVAAERIVAVLQTPTSRALALAGTENQPGATARMIYDPAEKTAVLLSQDMQPAAAGEVYQLWVVTADERKVSVGTFAPGPDGLATLVVDLPNDPGPVILAAVTNEPAGGSPQPTGQFQMLGEF